MEGRIKIHRKFIDRERYDDINTKIFFLHLLLIVNHKETKWRGITIPRGGTTRTLETLANETGLTKQNIRTVIKKLKSTQELTQEKIEKHWVITINNYDKYQSSTQELTPSQHDTNTGSTLNKNDNNEENEKKKKAPPKKVVNKYTEDFEKFWKKYPHARKGKKLEAYTFFKKNDTDKVMNELVLLNWKIIFNIQDGNFVPACERWIRDFTETSDVIKDKDIKKIVYGLMGMKGGKRKEYAQELIKDFGKDIVNEYVKMWNNEKNGITLDLKK